MEYASDHGAVLVLRADLIQGCHDPDLGLCEALSARMSGPGRSILHDPPVFGEREPTHRFALPFSHVRFHQPGHRNDLEAARGGDGCSSLHGSSPAGWSRQRLSGASAAPCQCLGLVPPPLVETNSWHPACQASSPGVVVLPMANKKQSGMLSDSPLHLLDFLLVQLGDVFLSAQSPGLRAAPPATFRAALQPALIPLFRWSVEVRSEQSPWQILLRDKMALELVGIDVIFAVPEASASRFPSIRWRGTEVCPPVRSSASP